MFKIFISHGVYSYCPCVIIGAIIYCVVQAIHSFINKRRKTNISHQKIDDDFKTSDELAEINNQSSDVLDYNLIPTLPENLKHIPLNFSKLPIEETLRQSEEFYKFMNQRRTVRSFSSDPIPMEVIRNLIKTAATAPSGVHTEPWTYVVVKSKKMKEKIRETIEYEEEINYKQRMGKGWITDLKPLRTTWIKEYLTDAPYLLLIFKQTYGFTEDNKKKMHYFNDQSIAIATGILLTAVHNAGLVTLTSSPLNCGSALRSLLNRPPNEKLSLLLPIGYPSTDCLIPDLQRKPVEKIMIEV